MRPLAACLASLTLSACCFALDPPHAPAPHAPALPAPAAPALEEAVPAPAREEAPAPAFLPPEAFPVLDAIARGGPFAYRQDDGTFQNRERRLPERPRGHYREYTVPTPGSRDRGARRIVTGGDPPTEFFYTDDHYGTFRRFDPPGTRP